MTLYACVCVVNIPVCDVPLQDVLRTAGSPADKTSSGDVKDVKRGDFTLKDADRTKVISTAPTAAAAAQLDKTSDRLKKTKSSPVKTVSDSKPRRRSKTVDKTIVIPDDNEQVDKTSDRPKKTTPSANKVVVEAAAKPQRTNTNDEKIRHLRQFRHSDDLLGDFSDKISSSTAPLVTSANTELVAKKVVSENEPKQRQRARKSVEAPAAVQPRYPADNRLKPVCGSTIRSVYTSGVDVSYGSEAVEDVIQRLLDNDELMEDMDQPDITSPRNTVITSSRTAPNSAVVSLDTRRNAEGSRRSSKSPRPAGKPFVKSPPLSMKSPKSSSQTCVSSETSVKLPASLSESSVKPVGYAVQQFFHLATLLVKLLINNSRITRK